jgi:hypothetical protein
MDNDKLLKIAKKWDIPIELLLSLIKASTSTQERKVGQLSYIEELIYNFLAKKNDNQ